MLQVSKRVGHNQSAQCGNPGKHASMMDTAKVCQEAYRRYWSVVEARSVSPMCSYLRYDQYQNGGKRLAYSYLERECTREILNTINLLVTALHRLAIWEEVLQRFSEEEQFEIRFELTHSLLYFPLHQPQEYRSRLIFCAVKLCYHAGLDRGTLQTQDLKDDGCIRWKDLKKLAGEWKGASVLVETIDKVHDAEYKNATGNFRNRRQHQIARGLDYGLIGLVTRETTEEGRTAFSFGVAHPISTAVVLPLLVGQVERMITAFHAYWDMVKEQTA